MLCFAQHLQLIVVDLSPSHSFFVALVSLGLRVALLVAVLLNTCRCSALSIDLFPFQSFFQCFRTPRVAVIVVDLSLFQSLLLWFAQYLESLCSLLPYLNCLNLSWFVLNTSSHSGRCSVASVDYLNTLTFVAPVWRK